ncbi:MAG: TolC family protein [candidate division WOR-3 bacterium]
MVFTNILSLFIITTYELSLTQCIALAKQYNLELQEVKTNVQIVNSQLKETYSSFYPAIEVSGGYQTFEEKNCQYSWGISSRYTIYRGGTRIWNLKISQLQLKDAKELYRQKENQIILQVKQNFYKIVKLQETEKLLRHILNRRRENLELIALNYESGRESALNLELSRINLEQIEYELQKLKTELKSAKYELATFLNLADTDFVLQNETKIAKIPNLDSMIEIALKKRPELIREDIAEKIYQFQLKTKWANYLPLISFNSSYGGNGQTLPTSRNTWGAGVSLGITLFDGFSREAQINEVKLALKNQSYRKERTKLNIINEVRKAFDMYFNAIQYLEIASRKKSVLTDAYRLTKLQYQQGRTSYFFLEQKENELTQAESDYINALYNLNNAWAQLIYAIGGEIL